MIIIYIQDQKRKTHLTTHLPTYPTESFGDYKLGILFANQKELLL